VRSTIGVFETAADAVRGWFESDDETARRRPARVTGSTVPAVPGLAEGKALMQQTNTPLASVTSNAISNSRATNKTTSVQIDRVDVNTQATDAAGVQRALGEGLSAQIKGAVDQMDDGVAA